MEVFGSEFTEYPYGSSLTYDAGIIGYPLDIYIYPSQITYYEDLCGPLVLQITSSSDHVAADDDDNPTKITVLNTAGLPTYMRQTDIVLTAFHEYYPDNLSEH